MSPGRRVRLVDVANELGVAPSTVSRALAGSATIPEATRARVVEAAANLGYRANPAASGLKRGVTLNIGLIAPLGGSWYSGALASGADNAAALAGYDFVVVTAGEVDGNAGLLARAERLGQRVDGAIVLDVSPAGNLIERLGERLGVPLVTVGCTLPLWPSVGIDNAALGATAGEYLASLGHQSLAALSLETPNAVAIDNNTARVAGFLRGSGRSSVNRQVLPRVSAAARRPLILDATKRATAVFCTSDELAIEVMAVLTQNGRSVPGDVSVIGVDDHPLADAVGLTTVAQDPKQTGIDAATLLLECIADPLTPSRIDEETTLVVRSTTAPPPPGEPL